MSETPKKKAPAKKSTSKKKAPAKKQGTGKRGRPPKVANQVAKLKDELIKNDIVPPAVEPLLEKAKDEAVKLAEKVDEVVDQTADKVVIFANDIKKQSLRTRMLKWFKRK